MNADPNPAKAIFLEAVEQYAPDQWPAFLDRACAGQPDLRGRVEALLTAHREVGTAQHRGLAEGADPSPVATVAEPSVRERPGTVIGPYKLLEQIGEGGFGVVFLAEQTEPVRRKVALKILKPGMDTRQVVARFEAERQALAIMDHPNIAKVFDGGATLSGRPYFVMELVKGVPITEFCDQHHLTPRQRLELFIPVCQAVQHAHQKGIIHRDLKPSNVLVSRHDTTPVVKVIDFGVAKALGQELTDKTLFTGMAQMVGTPLYMSPEQAGMSDLDIDTRSDIYSLGVLLYELLTGTTPFDRERFKKAAYDEIRRIIREEEPPRPSTRLSEATASLPSISAQRQTEPTTLTKLVRGELDWIVMKALEKDRNRRYETANGFALDVQRYLADEPVQACPPSAGYRLRKFVRRNKGSVLAASLVMLTFVGGFIGTAWAMVRAVAAEATAVDEAIQKEAALKDKTAQLWESLVAEARATRLSHRGGQRFKSLEILQRARELASTLNLPAAKLHEQRNAALAALAVPDLYLAGPWVTCPADVYAFDFDENHAICACTDWQGVCIIRRVADDVELYRLPGLGTPAKPFLSRNGKFLAVAYVRARGTGPAVKVWQLDPAAPRPLLTETGAGWVDFHRNSQQIALAYEDGAIRLFELPSGRLLNRLAADPSLTREFAIALHPTEPLVAVCSYFGSVVNLRDVQTGKVLATLPADGRAMSVAWHPDGRTLAVGLEALAIRLYDRTTLRLFRTLKTDISVFYLAFNHAGDRLAAVGWGERAQMFDVGTGQKLFTTPPVRWSRLRFSRDDRRLAGAAVDGKLGAWQVGDSREYRTLVHSGLPREHWYRAAAVHPDGRLLAISTSTGFGLWDLATGSERGFAEAGDLGDHLVVFEPSGSLLVLGPAGLLRWPIPKDVAAVSGVIGPPERLPLPGGNTLAQSSDGRVIVSSSRASGATQAHAGGWILHTDRKGPPLPLDAGADIGFITVSPNGKWVVTCVHDGGVTKVWNARDGKPERKLAERMQGIPQFSPDGRWLSTSLDGGRLVAVGTWEMGPKTAPGSGVFSPDSKLLAVPTPDGIHLIDHATGREVALLEDPNLDLASITFTPDGTKLIALNAHNGAHVWDLRLMRRRLKEMDLDWQWPEFAADAGNVHAPPSSVPPVIDIVGDVALFARMRKCQAAKDVAGCRAAAVMWEKAYAHDATGLYNAACMRALTAATLRAAAETGPAAKEADAEADRALGLLKQAVAAGWNNVAHMKQDSDLDSLRERDDFKSLVRDLEAKHSKR